MSGRVLRCPRAGCRSADLEVLQLLQNRSAFNGYRPTPSRWSEVRCRNCRHRWRTASRLVLTLPAGDPTTA